MLVTNVKISLEGGSLRQIVAVDEAMDAAGSMAVEMAVEAADEVVGADEASPLYMTR
jgi:hypothetical protein